MLQLYCNFQCLALPFCQSSSDWYTHTYTNRLPMPTWLCQPRHNYCWACNTCNSIVKTRANDWVTIGHLGRQSNKLRQLFVEIPHMKWQCKHYYYWLCDLEPTQSNRNCTNNTLLHWNFICNAHARLQWCILLMIHRAKPLAFGFS